MAHWPGKETDVRDAETGRPARIVSISFSCRPLAAIVDVVAREAARGADLIALPETWANQSLNQPETLDGPIISTLADLARRHRTYIVCPLDRQEGDRRLNSAVLLDRTGAVAGIYDKLYPYWSEFALQPAVAIGSTAPVFATDFGRVGCAICYDVNFPEVWQELADNGAELVVWPSAYSAGTTLQAHALIHHYYIVTSTQTADCLVYDVDGRLLLDEKSDDVTVSRITLDLDRGIYHENFNLAPLERLLAEHGDDVAVERHLPREQWIVLRAKRPGVSVRALARAYGMEELRDYIARSRRQIDEMRTRQAATPALAGA
jgi:predicted amidohydrolase